MFKQSSVHGISCSWTPWTTWEWALLCSNTMPSVTLPSLVRYAPLKHLTVNGLQRSMGPSMSLWFCLDGITTLHANVMKKSNVLHISHIPSLLPCFTKISANVFMKSGAHLCHLHCHKWVSVVHALLQVYGLNKWVVLPPIWINTAGMLSAPGIKGTNGIQILKQIVKRI